MPATPNQRVNTTIQSSHVHDLCLPACFCGLVLLLAGWMLYHYHPHWVAHPELCKGDCRSYRTIAQSGYWYKEGVRSNTNFFPLFPYLWRWSGLGEWGISFVNLLCYISGSYLLFQKFISPLRVKIISLATGCVIFYMAPFSEGMFYLASVLLLVALKEKRTMLIYCALTALCLLRPVSILFVPAWLFIATLKYLDTRSVKNCLPYLLYALYGLFIIGLIFLFEWQRTGEWLAFVKAQRVWGTWVRYPHLPFSAWGDDRHMVFAQYAVFISLVCCLCLAKILLSRLAKTIRKSTLNDAALFGLLYLAGNGLFPLLMRGADYSSLNRYILATPFLYIFLRELSVYKFSRKELLVMLAVELVYLFICWEMYANATRLILAALFIPATLIIPWLLQSRSRLVVAGIAIAAAVGIYLQAVQLVDLVSGFWVG